MKGVEKSVKWLAILILMVSLLFFIMGFNYPLLKSGFGIGPFNFNTEYIYISTSFRYFFDNGEVFIGTILLLFTIVFPIAKYIFLFFTLLGKKVPRHGAIATILEIMNKWAMLDVFVVAILILNMKFGSGIIISRLQLGTTLFAFSVILLTISAMMAKKTVSREA